MKMKKSILVITALQICSFAFCQTKISKGAKLKAQIIALEKAGWDAWKNKDTAWFRKNTTEACLWISSDGITNKAQMMQSTATDCQVKNASLDDFTFEQLNENTVLLSYVVLQDGSCAGKKLTGKLRASVNYVRRGNRWLEAFYMETPFAQ
jgi:hypothetical protein